MSLEPTTRFSDRVENYIKYRPHYPPEIISFLEQEIGLTPSKVVADIGSGTGIFTELLVQHDNTVYAVEPNGPMREAAESLLASHPNFHSINGTAEATTLPDASIDVITCAQAFHWFNIPTSLTEFKRILQPDGWTVLLWNIRNPDSTPFLAAYEAFLIDYGNGYPVVADESLPDRVGRFFPGSGFRQKDFYNYQLFDFDGLKGRLLSSSYIPQSGDRYDEMLKELRVIFDRFSQNGEVRFEYETNVYYGRV